MKVSAFWNEAWTVALINHLWQSTVVASIAWLLAMALRKNHARARYWVWMAASLKFLFPLSLLMSAGEGLGSLVAVPIAAKPALANVMEHIAQPFAQPQLSGAAIQPANMQYALLLPILLLAVWACGALLVVARWARDWRRLRDVVGAASPRALAADVPVFCSPSLLEPGVFGIFKPVLLLPDGILDRLTSDQLQAIIAHEMCHLRRRDNLTFAVHMVVETLFWFHPAVWWIGARLVEERERACDEAVLQSGGRAEIYAEGILNVCKFYVESPLKCFAGVTGSDLKKRVVRIMTGGVVQNLSIARKLLLGAVGAISLMVPVVFGVVRATAQQEQDSPAESKQWKFAVVSIRKNNSGGPKHIGVATADGYQMKNLFLGYLLLTAYVPQTGGAVLYSVDQFLGMPAWLISDDDHYDVDAKVDEADLADWKNPAKQPAMQRSMLQALLEDRLKLAVHRSTREAPVYLLTVGKNGPKFKETNPGELHPGARPMPGGGTLSSEVKEDQMTVHYFGISIAQLARWVLGDAGRPVEDKTGLAGRYDVTIQRPALQTGTQQGGISAPDLGPSAASIADQLGLRLEPAKGQVETLVIDHVERPSPN